LQSLKDFEGALDAWEQFVQRYPQDPRISEAYYQLGVCAFHLERFDRAIDALQKALAGKLPREMREAGLFALGLSQLERARRQRPSEAEKALETFRQLIKEYPRSRLLGEVRFHEGEAYYLLGNRAEAVTKYQAALSAQLPADVAAEVTYALGVCFEELNRLQEAASVYDRFLKDFSEHQFAPDVRMRRADLLFAAKEFESARALFQAAAQAPGFELADYAWTRWADCLAAMEQFQQAADLYLQLVKKFPQSKYLVNATASAGKCLVRLKRWEEARQYLEKAIAAGGQPAEEAWYFLALMWLESGQPVRALETVDKAQGSVQDPQIRPLLHLLRAEAAEAIADRKHEAPQLFAAVADKFPQSSVAAEARWRAAEVAQRLGQYDFSLEQAGAFLREHPKSPFLPEVLLIAAEGELVSGRPDKAEPLYERLIKEFANHPAAEAARVRRAWVFLLRGDPAGLITWLEKQKKGVQKPELVAEADYLLGEAYLQTKQYAASVSAFEAANASKVPIRDKDRLTVRLGRAYLLANRPEDAARILSDFAQKWPQSPLAGSAYFTLGETLVRQKRYAEAIQAFQQSAKLESEAPQVAEALYQVATLQMDLGHYAAAVESFSSVLGRSGLAPSLLGQAQYGRAVALVRLKRFQQALSDLDAFLATGPQEPQRSDARYLKGICHFELKQYDTAIATFQNLRDQNPQYPNMAQVLYQLGWAQKAAGKPEVARATFEQLIDKHGDSAVAAEAYYHVGQFLAQEGAYSRAAIAFYRAATGQKTESPAGKELKEKASFQLGWCYFKMRDWPRARQTTQALLKQASNPNLIADAQFLLAESRFEEARQAQQDLDKKLLEGSAGGRALGSGERDEAETKIRGLYESALKEYRALMPQLAAVSQDEWRSTSLLHAGQAAAQLGQWAESQQWFDRLCRDFPNSPHVPFALCEQGWALYQLKQVDPAMQVFQRAVERGQNSEPAARAQFLIGQLQFEKKEYRQAIKSFLTVAYGYGYPVWQANSLFEAARCYEVLGRPEEAKKLYEELIAKFSEKVPDKTQLARQKLNSLKSGGGAVR